MAGRTHLNGLSYRPGESWQVMLICLVVISAIFLRFWHLNADIPLLQSADDLGDEGYWAWRARDLIYHGTIDIGSNFYQALAGAPLTVFLLHALGSLSGNFTLWEARFFTAFFSSILLLAGSYYLAYVRGRTMATLIFIALYGLFPLTLFYSRIGHLEQGVLLFLLLSFISIEEGNSPFKLLLAGLFAGIACSLKLIAIVIFPALFIYFAMRPGRRFYLYFFSGLLIGLSPYLFTLATLSISDLLPTFIALASYHRKSGFFIDSFSINYFWLSPLVKPYLFWLLPGVACCMYFSVKHRRLSWEEIWMFSVLIIFSLFKYQSFARHMLFIFPVIMITSLGLSEFVYTIGSKNRRHTVATLITAGILLHASVATATIGKNVYLKPKYTYLNAARQLSAITDKSDRVAGPHAHIFSIASQYKPRMKIRSRYWRDIDRNSSERPNIVLISRQFNGRHPAPRAFPRRGDFKYLAKLERLNYLDRFEVDVYRVFYDKEAFEDFLSFRSTRPSRYDSLIYNTFKDNHPLGCMVKAVQVAESRGDKEISHLKVSKTGCVGMFGFCYKTARDPIFKGIFKRLKKPAYANPQNDDRFSPLLSIKAAALYINRLKQNFSGLDRDFVFAAYNSGPAFVKYLIKLSGLPKPSWDSEILPLLKSGAADNFPYYNKWPPKKRDHKLQYELPLYVSDAVKSYNVCIATDKPG